jgi:hypothetical protein
MYHAAATHPPVSVTTATATREANPTVQIVAAMVGALATTLASSTLGGSPTGNLVAAAVGAALPPFATYVGPRQHLRLGAAVAAIAIALGVTYGGVTLFDAAAGKQTFPGPNTPAPAPGPSPGEPTPEPGEAGIRVTPDVLRCTPDGCERPVVIESTGSEPLRTADIEIEGDHFSAGDECEQRVIEDSCEFTVAYEPPEGVESATAELVVLQDPRTVVRLEGEGGAATEATLSAAACTLGPGPVAHFTLTAEGPEGATVPVAIALADGTAEEHSITVGVPTAIDVELAAEPVPPLAATVTLDGPHNLDCS